MVRQWLVWSALVVLAACSSSHQAPTPVALPEAPPAAQPGGAYKIGQPYQINGIWYYPKADPTYDQTGIASWYGAESRGRPFNGLQTANGDTYDMDGMTAAHQTLPMPTKVRVTNLENGRSVELTVNDRGPFANGRIIDVSRRAARLLGFYDNGTAKVRVQVIDTIASGTFVAERPVTPPDEAKMTAAPRDRVIASALPPPPGIKAEPLRPAEKPPKPKTEVPLTASVGRVDPQNPEITLVPVPKQTAIYIQVGAFTNADNARRLRDQVDHYGPAWVSKADVKGQTFHRVRLGPIPNVDVADDMLSRVIAQFPAARIIVD